MTSVGLFTYSTKPRGSVVHATYLAEALTARGHDVTLYALSKAGDLLYRELACPVVYLEAEKAPAHPDSLIAQRVREVARGIARLRPRHDVYHAEDCLAASGLLASRGELGGAPLVRTLHHLEHFDSAYLQDCQRRSIVEASAVACVSKLSQRDVARAFGRQCPIIGNGVDVARFAKNPSLERACRARFSIGPSDVVVLSVGGVEPRKNTLRTLEAMIPVLLRNPQARWLIAGGASIWEHDAYRGAFFTRLAELSANLRSRMVVLGSVTEQELSGLYGVSQILLCPSLQEGFGLCVLEAMAAQNALVVADAAPFTEYLPRDAACFVDPASESSIGAAVERLLQDERLRSALAAEGAVRAPRFSWDRVAVEHEELYRGLLAATRRQPASAYEERAHA
ncbi:MAG TPA: MSMEG_0565 family glycosyltransferase [Polyangiaceae bacterium]|nr:MSMEG_0565 family glycosyltransferase [Polyangiaceae bacterium]